MQQEVLRGWAWLAAGRAVRVTVWRELTEVRAGVVSLRARFAAALEQPVALEGYLAHTKTPTPLGPPYDPGHSPTVGSCGVVVSCERGTSVEGATSARGPAHGVAQVSASLEGQQRCGVSGEGPSNRTVECPHWKLVGQLRELLEERCALLAEAEAGVTRLVQDAAARAEPL